MAETSIEWTATPRTDGSMAPGYTFNPWWGCTKVSPGCAHCYAETFAKRVGQKVWGGDAERRFFGDAHWNEPEKWNRVAAAWPERRKVFCASMADVFEDGRGLGSQRTRLFELIEKTTSLDWLLLTKRPQNVRVMVPLRWLDAWPSNAWLGTTCEDQERADERIPHLLGIPAPVRFLSCEPLLGPIEFSDVTGRSDAVRQLGKRVLNGIDWVIVGGESGPGAREFHVDWARSIVRQCRAAGVPVFVKQLGARVRDRNDAGFDGDDPSEWPEGTETGASATYQGADLPVFLQSRKGGDMAEWPEHLRVREFPRAHASDRIECRA